MRTKSKIRERTDNNGLRSVRLTNLLTRQFVLKQSIGLQPDEFSGSTTSHGSATVSFSNKMLSYFYILCLLSPVYMI